jgi:hypothetical protein
MFADKRQRDKILTYKSKNQKGEKNEKIKKHLGRLNNTQQ